MAVVAADCYRLLPGRRAYGLQGVFCHECVMSSCSCVLSLRAMCCCMRAAVQKRLRLGRVSLSLPEAFRLCHCLLLCSVAACRYLPESSRVFCLACVCMWEGLYMACCLAGWWDRLAHNLLVHTNQRDGVSAVLCWAILPFTSLDGGRGLALVLGTFWDRAAV